MEEPPTPERVLAGDSLHYDEEGNACAVCVICGCVVDIAFDDYVEMAITKKRGLGMERTGARWWWCAACYELRAHRNP